MQYNYYSHRQTAGTVFNRKNTQLINMIKYQYKHQTPHKLPCSNICADSRLGDIPQLCLVQETTQTPVDITLHYVYKYI